MSLETEPTWFHVFNTTQCSWLQDNQQSWGSYRNAAEFYDFQAALLAARTQLTRDQRDDVVTILADCGAVNVCVE